MDKADKAVSIFSEQKFNCAQAVLAAFADDYGVDRDTALRLATGFGSGIARTAQTCGAVTGAIMVIGLAHGRTRTEDVAARDTTYRLAEEFLRRFTQREKGVTCEQLLGKNVWHDPTVDPAWLKQQHDTLCPGFVRAAAEILEELLHEER